MQTLSKVKNIKISAQVFRAGGKVENYGIISEYNAKKDNDKIYFSRDIISFIPNIFYMSPLLPFHLRHIANYVGTLFVNSGKAFVAGKMSGEITTSPNRIAWGTGTTDPVLGNTTLETEAPEARATATLSRTITTVTNDTFNAVGTITATGSRTISESGLLDAASGGNLIVRDTFAGIPVINGDSIQLTYTLQFS